MTRVVDVLMICFKSIFFKKALEERKFEVTDELNKNDDDDADKRKRDTWKKRKRRWLRLLLTVTATSTLTQFWWQVEAIIDSDDSSEANEIAVIVVNSNDNSE